MMAARLVCAEGPLVHVLKQAEQIQVNDGVKQIQNVPKEVITSCQPEIRRN